MNNYLLRVLSIRPFFFLFLSEIFSQIAMNMTNFILIIVAFELTKSNTAVSLIVLSFTVPTIIFGILAGVYVDRWNKKQVLFLTNIIRAF
ncbi:MAG: MFS transporter, partial [Candidatus Levybacteria bacterium]|nr:MFS transporter [Candidatus Levybacteria bacterium]